MAKNNNKRKRNKAENWRKKKTSQNQLQPQDKREQQFRAVSLCPVCGNSTYISTINPAVSYCPTCSLFFLNSEGKNPSASSLSEVLKAIRELSGGDFLFKKRIIGIVKCIFPKIKDGELSVLRRLISPELKICAEALHNDTELNSAEVDFFVSKTGLDRNTVISVFNSVRTALGKKSIQETDSITTNKSLIISFVSSAKEAAIGEKIKISWVVVKNSKYSYLLQSSDLEPKAVKSEGSIWLQINEETTVFLKIIYRGTVLETKEITISLAEPPEILTFYSDLTPPIIESHLITLKWISRNAEKLTLVHKYNDYEQLSVDVSQNNGEISFNVFRSELIELIAERRNLKSRQSIMIEVSPLPKFKSVELPNIINFPNPGFAKIPILRQDKRFSLLMDYLKDSSLLSQDFRYLSLTEHLKHLFKIAYGAIRF